MGEGVEGEDVTKRRMPYISPCKMVTWLELARESRGRKMWVKRTGC